MNIWIILFGVLALLWFGVGLREVRRSLVRRSRIHKRYWGD